MPWNFLLFVVTVILLLAVQLLNRAEDPLQTVAGGVVTDLGVARYPAGVGTQVGIHDARMAVHDWHRPDEPARYRLAYAHGLAAGRAIEADQERLASRFAFRWAEDASFRWRIPDECLGQEWTCIYGSLLARSEVDLEPLLARIEAGFDDESWTTTAAARWLLAFVQQIPYRVPTTHAFGVLPPALVASRDWGDCDSKSLLLIHLLDHFGIDAVLLVSEAHAHALVGVGVPTGGESYSYRGREWAWAETTAPDAPLGWLPPKWQTPDDWRVVPLE